MQNTENISNSERYIARSFPQRIEIELVSACNLRCTYCPRRYISNLNGFMTFSLFKKIIDEMSDYPQTILVLHRRGESLLHPDFVKICEYVKTKFKNIQLATNATLLDEVKSKAIIQAIHFISFSIDIHEVFEKIRIPAKYHEVETNILKFLALNNGRVQTQVSMVKTLDTPLKNTEIFKKIWIDKVDRIRIYEEHSRDGKFGSLNRNRGKRQPCVMPFYDIIIYSDGKVGRCNHDWDGSGIGDLKQTTIKEIWNNHFYTQLRRQHRMLCIKDEVCKYCDSWYQETGKQGTGETIT